MHITFPPVALCALTLGLGGLAHAQGMPTSQPGLLTIIREEVKLGRGAEHERIEAGWPAAFEKAKSQATYIALTAMTGIKMINAETNRYRLSAAMSYVDQATKAKDPAFWAPKK